MTSQPVPDGYLLPPALDDHGPGGDPSHTRDPGALTHAEAEGMNTSRLVVDCGDLDALSGPQAVEGALPCTSAAATATTAVTPCAPAATLMPPSPWPCVVHPRHAQLNRRVAIMASQMKRLVRSAHSRVGRRMPMMIRIPPIVGVPALF